MPQVVTISPEGVVSGLQVKPGRGLDLTKLGPAEVVRASEIVWDTEAQAWKIDVLQEVGKGVVTWTKFREAMNGRPIARANELIGSEAWAVVGNVLMFHSYDDAVKVEIAFLDALRLNGGH